MRSFAKPDGSTRSFPNVRPRESGGDIHRAPRRSCSGCPAQADSGRDAPRSRQRCCLASCVRTVDGDEHLRPDQPDAVALDPPLRTRAAVGADRYRRRLALVDDGRGRVLRRRRLQELPSRRRALDKTRLPRRPMRHRLAVGLLDRGEAGDRAFDLGWVAQVRCMKVDTIDRYSANGQCRFRQQSVRESRSCLPSLGGALRKAF